MSKRLSYVDSIYATHMNGGRQNSNPTINEQQLTERMYLRMMTELACNRFEWKNLPPEIDPRFLEVTLFRGALSVFTQLSNKLYGDKFFALQGSPAGKLDPYENPQAFAVYGNSFIHGKIDRKHCVPIWANYLRVPDHDIVLLYVHRLSQLDRTIAIAAMNMRNTNFVFASENTQLSMENIIRQRDAGEMTAYVSKQFDPTQIFAIDMKQHPDTLPKLMVAKSKMWNECMTLLGINNANQDKPERLVADEVAANDQQIEATRRIALNARQQAVEEINRKWGLSIEVDFHVSDMAVQAPQGPGEGEETDNASVHTDTSAG